MAKFVSCTQLYETVQQKSKEAKEVLWVCSPYLGLEAHEVFAQEATQHAPADARFVFRINHASVKAGEVNPYEVEFFMEHFGNSNVRCLDAFRPNIYIFDDSALVTSADLTKAAFESNVEAGVLLDGSEAEAVKNFFCVSLWENAKPVKDVKKFKKIWNPKKESVPDKKTSKGKAITRIEPWTGDSVNTWYFSVLDPTAKKAVRKIQKEANWAKNLELVSDIGPNAFRLLKLGDMAFLADLTKKRTNTITTKFTRVFDKGRVETDAGDLHFAYETKKTYATERTKFHEMLKSAGIPAKSSEILLTQDQVNLMTNALSSTKPKKRRKASKKQQTRFNTQKEPE